MKIIIQAIGFEVTGDIESFITEALRELLQYSVTIIRAEIILGEDNTDDGHEMFCNIRLLTTGIGYLVAQHGSSWKHAVTAATTELLKKIKKDVTRHQ